MKSMHWKFFASALLVIGCVCVACKRENAQTVAAPVGTPAGVPTEAEIANFIARYQDPADASKFVFFNATFESARLRPDQMEGYRTRGKIPFTISVSLSRAEQKETWIDHYAIMEGQVKIAVLDADGKLADRQEEDLASLCPSWTNEGGYLGEVTKPGNYKAIVWTTYEGRVFGKVLEAKLDFVAE